MRRRPSPGHLAVIFAADPGPRIHALAEVLIHRGHSIARVSGMREILEAGVAHAGVLVIDSVGRPETKRADEERATQLLSEIGQAGVSIPTIVIANEPGFEFCRLAVELGAADIVSSAFDPSGLVDAVEGAIDPNRRDPQELRNHFVEYSIADDDVEFALAQLDSFLDASDVAPPHRVRILCATAEIIDNARRHASTDDGRGSFSVEASIRRTRILVTIRDGGNGFDADSARLDSIPAPLPRPRLAKRNSIRRVETLPDSGIARSSRLSEGLDVRSDSTGSVVELEFELTPVRFEQHLFPSISSLVPDRIVALAREVHVGRKDTESLPSVMALTMCRLVGRVRVEKAIDQG